MPGSVKIYWCMGHKSWYPTSKETIRVRVSSCLTRNHSLHSFLIRSFLLKVHYSEVINVPAYLNFAIFSIWHPLLSPPTESQFVCFHPFFFKSIPLSCHGCDNTKLPSDGNFQICGFEASVCRPWIQWIVEPSFVGLVVTAGVGWFYVFIRYNGVVFYTQSFCECCVSKIEILKC